MRGSISMGIPTVSPLLLASSSDSSETAAPMQRRISRHPRAPARLGRNVNVRKQKEEIAVSVVLVIVGRGDVAARPHGTAATGLGLKRLFAFPASRYLHS